MVERREPEGGELRAGARWPSAAEEIARRFDELIRGRWEREIFEAPADVFVLDHEVWVEIDLPGVEAAAVQAFVEAGWLCIEAERRCEPPAAARATRLERRRGRLARRIALPLVVEAPEIEIALEAGVLRVRVRPGGAP